MVDFLKSNPYVTREEYMWEWTIPQIKLASLDFTHVIYIDNDKPKSKIVDGSDLKENYKNLGMSVF
ncbi:MAG: hypothetical protein ACI35S_06740 [Anaeroplasma sp.]